jgi:subtilisin family serine protease
LYTFGATGRGVTIFIADGGVRSTHREFTGRFVACEDFSGEGCASHSSHGTHVGKSRFVAMTQQQNSFVNLIRNDFSISAATALGTTFGVAKEASLYDLKVLSSAGSGSYASVIAGFNHVAALKRANPRAMYVLNASLAAGFSELLNRAIASVVATGVVAVVAAGNGNADACRGSPGSETSAITVGATNRDDQRSANSNFGTCVDLFAPGTAIISADNASDQASTTLSGTSMAAPHVAGIVALFMGTGRNPYRVISRATRDVISNPNGSPNRLAYSAP